MMNNILIVDDDHGLRSALVKYLKQRQFCIEEASSGSLAIKKALTNDYDVVILDQMMPEMTGTEVLTELKKISPRSKIIMMTGFGTVHDATEAIKKGASQYLLKPCNLDELERMIRRCLEEKQFDMSLKKLDLDFTLSTLSNPIRRSILKLIKSHTGIHFMKITRALGMDDHTKVVFHLKNLISTGLIEKDEDKGYHLTKEGKKTYNCLTIIENYLSV